MPTGLRPHRRVRLLVTVAAVILAVDIVTKVLAVRLLTPGQPVSIIGETVTWTLVRNSGAAFSMATGYTWILTLIATAVVIGIVWMGRRLVSPWWALGLGMILGGALGNLVDRFFRWPGPLRGHVVDFLSIGWWPVFNVADASVVGGAVLLVSLSLFGYDFDTVGRRKPARKRRWLTGRWLSPRDWPECASTPAWPAYWDCPAPPPRRWPRTGPWTSTVPGPESPTA